MSKPISSSLLIHQCSYYPVSTKDAYGKITYGTEQTIKKCRIDSLNKQTVNSLGEKTILLALLFFDSVRSTPKTITFSELDKIVFNSITYTVREISYLYDREKLHHIEVGLQ